MSKLRYLPYAALAAILLAGTGASAQTWYDSRQENLQDRMNAGRRDGSLTPYEYRMLDNRMDRIERYERRAERDGVVTAEERRRLDRMLDRQGRAIHDQRTDRQGWDRDGWRHSNWGHGRNDWRHDGRHDRWDGRHWGHNHGWGNHHGWDNRAGINQRQEWQDRRIDNGVRNGSITTEERARLDRRETRINNFETRARADGNLSGRERHRLNGMLDRQSHAINHARNNNRVATTTPTTTSRTSGGRSGGRNGGGRNR
ncbi:MAG TPA: hypothetical protein VEC14_08590 [Reyranellaceae bacterium]|nr:hypothetical protein [Reyranellaceae bacterium]